jgi:hypothetical protein
MSGRWVSQAAKKHVCDRPRYGVSAEEKIVSGDQWMCDICHKVWVVSIVSYGDQRDPIPQGYVSDTGWKEVLVF